MAQTGPNALMVAGIDTTAYIHQRTFDLAAAERASFDQGPRCKSQDVPEGMQMDPMGRPVFRRPSKG